MMRSKILLCLLLAGLLLGSSVACSVGSLLVRAPTPTLEPTRTPRPTFTFTPDWSPTPPPTLTFTPSPVPPTPTETPQPTPTPEEEAEAEAPTNTPVPAGPPTEPPPPPPPTDTPPPAEPTPTPTPEFPFTVTPYTFNTGSGVESRITFFVADVIDASVGNVPHLEGYNLVVIDPTGAQHVSGPSGGRNHTTMEGLGDDRWMNGEVKVAPYTPGRYTAWLEKDGVQQSPKFEFEMAGQPFQYVHLDVFMYH